jgi:hypothetical protein
MAEQPNDASRKSKAEGDRPDETSRQAAPSRGQAKCGPPGGLGDPVNLQPLDTPRRYDQPIEDDDDPVMASDDTTLNTKT